MKENVKFVVVGHVDHGKSTLIGRLLYDTDSLPQDKIEEIRKASEKTGLLPEFAFVMDHLEEERKNRITIDTAQIFFKTAKRDYTIIDAPGHRQFLKNMITGSTQAEAAVLLIDAEQGLAEQTHRHALVLRLLGVKQIIVLINKMDLVAYSEQRFDELKDQTVNRLCELGMEACSDLIIPVSAQLGDNIALKSGNLGWYDGLTVLQALDELQPARRTETNVLRLPIQDVYDIDGERVLVGRIASGVISVGDDVVFQPCGVSATVKQIKKFEAQPDKAAAGDSIGLILTDEGTAGALERGQIACAAGDGPDVSETVEAVVFWMSDQALQEGDTLDFKCATMQTGCQIVKIADRLDSSTLEPISDTNGRLRDTEIAKLTMQMDGCVATDPFEKVAQTGRFVLIRDNDTVAGGVLHEDIKAVRQTEGKSQ
ncbi:MAG: GTP-binding protein [Planctomycetota bacterium]